MFCGEFFCQAHRKIAFFRLPKLKLTANSAVTAKKKICRDGLSANNYFSVSLCSRRQHAILPRTSHGKDVFCRELFLADRKIIFVVI
jgi:hypothetical protein